MILLLEGFAGLELFGTNNAFQVRSMYRTHILVNVSQGTLVVDHFMLSAAPQVTANEIFERSASLKKEDSVTHAQIELAHVSEMIFPFPACPI